METPAEQLARILTAWNSHVVRCSNGFDEEDDAKIGGSHSAFNTILEDIAVNNGHPPGKPPRKFPSS